jgi:hypothetical protein
MRTSACVAALVVVVSAGGVRAEEPQPQLRQGRGVATVAGLSLLALGLGGAGLGIAGLLNTSESQAMLTRYVVGEGGTSDPGGSDVLEQRVTQGTILAAVGWVAAGVGLLGGVLLLLVDTPSAPHVAFIPLQSGGGLISCAVTW